MANSRALNWRLTCQGADAKEPGMLLENNMRTGEVSEEAYRAILLHLPRQLVWVFAYGLGVRNGELLYASGRRITKSGQPHIIPLYDSKLRAFVGTVLSKRDLRCPICFNTTAGS